MIAKIKELKARRKRLHDRWIDEQKQGKRYDAQQTEQQIRDLQFKIEHQIALGGKGGDE